MTSTQEQISEVQAQLQLEISQAELSEVRRLRQASETQHAMLHETGQQIGDQQGFLFDDPRFRRDPRINVGYFPQLDDRLHGNNRPFYFEETELARIRGDARLLAEGNEVGMGVMLALANFTLGPGFTHGVSPRDDKDSNLAKNVDEWLDEFDSRIGWRQVEREHFLRAPEDGESLIQLRDMGGGRADLFFREPEALTKPSESRQLDEFIGEVFLEWDWGIATRPDRPDVPIAYFIDLTGDQTDFEIVIPEMICHYRRNIRRNVKRGLSDFFPVSASLRRADKTFRNMGEGAALQSTIAWIREHPSGTSGNQVLNLLSPKREIDIDQPTLDGSTRTRSFQRYLPGTILDVRAGTSYKAGPMGEGTVFVDVSQAILTYAGVRWNMPSFMITGALEGNFASTLVAETPWSKAIEAEQAAYSDEVRKLRWKVLGVAIRAGRFRRWAVSTVADLQARVTLDIQVPPPSPRQKLEETKIRDLLFQRKMLSLQTWADKESLDFRHEQSNREKEPELHESPEGVLRNAGFQVGLSDREFQPQANEPGNDRAMPETRMK